MEFAELDRLWRSWPWLLSTVAVTLVTVTAMRRNRTKRRSNLPPGPPKWPVVGCLPYLPFGLAPELMFAKLAEKYGDLMLLWMGKRPYVVVSNARVAMAFLKKHDAQFANRPVSVAHDYVSFKGNSVISLSASDPAYQRLRLVYIMEILSPNKIAESRELRKEQILEMLQAIRGELDASDKVDLRKVVSAFSLNFSVCMIFGRHSGGKVMTKEIETLVLTFKKMVKLMERINISDLLPSLRRLDIQGIERELRDVEIQLRESIMVLIEQKKVEMSSWSSSEMDDGANERDVMSKLLSLEGEECLNDNQQMGVVFTLLLEGTESISKVLGKALEEVLKHPPLHKRAVDELDKVVGRTRLVEESDISKLPFLQNIIKETLRLHPPAQLLTPHGNVEACDVAGYHIPARSSVLINLYALSRDPSFWDSPLEFSPDRFMGSNLTVRANNFHYIPFGYGKRVCPGLNLGMTTLHYGLALCLQCIDWRLSAGIAVTETSKDLPALFVGGELRVDPRLLSSS